MHTLLSNMGRAFLRAFGAALIVVGIGISQQPTLHAAVLLGIAGLMASLAAGLAAIQTFFPSLTVASLIPGTAGRLVDSFLRAAIAAFVTAIIGLLAEPSLTAWKAGIVAVLVGAFAAGLRAVQAALTKGETPFANSGIPEP